MSRYGNRADNGRYARSSPYYDPNDKVRCAALQAHSNRLANEVAHQMLDRDVIRLQLKLRRGEHPDLSGGRNPNQRTGADGAYPGVIDGLIQAAYYAHLQTGWNRRHG